MAYKFQSGDAVLSGSVTLVDYQDLLFENDGRSDIGTAAAEARVVYTTRLTASVGLSGSAIYANHFYGNGDGITGISADDIDVVAGSADEVSPMIYAAAGSVGTSGGQPLGTAVFGFNPTSGKFQVPGDISGSDALAGKSVLLGQNGQIGAVGDTDLLTLTSNNLDLKGRLSQSFGGLSFSGSRADFRVFGGDNRRIVIDNVGLAVTDSDDNDAFFADFDGNVSGSEALKGKSVLLGANGFMGVVGDTNLLQLAPNKLSVEGDVSGSRALNGNTWATSGGNLSSNGDLVIDNKATFASDSVQIHSSGKVGVGSSLKVSSSVSASSTLSAPNLTLNNVTITTPGIINTIRLTGSIGLSGSVVHAGRFFGNGAGITGITSDSADVDDVDNDVNYQLVGVASSGEGATLVTDDDASFTFNPSTLKTQLPGEVALAGETGSAGSYLKGQLVINGINAAGAAGRKGAGVVRLSGSGAGYAPAGWGGAVGTIYGGLALGSAHESGTGVGTLGTDVQFTSFAHPAAFGGTKYARMEHYNGGLAFSGSLPNGIVPGDKQSSVAGIEIQSSIVFKNESTFMDPLIIGPRIGAIGDQVLVSSSMAALNVNSENSGGNSFMGIGGMLLGHTGGGNALIKLRTNGGVGTVSGSENADFGGRLQAAANKFVVNDNGNVTINGPTLSLTASGQAMFHGELWATKNTFSVLGDGNVTAGSVVANGIISGSGGANFDDTLRVAKNKFIVASDGGVNTEGGVVAVGNLNTTAGNISGSGTGMVGTDLKVAKNKFLVNTNGSVTINGPTVSLSGSGQGFFDAEIMAAKGKFLVTSGADVSATSFSGSGVANFGGALQAVENKFTVDASANVMFKGGLTATGLGDAGGVVLATDLMVIDDGAAGSIKTTSLADYATAIAGAGLTATAGVLSTDEQAVSALADANSTLAEGTNYLNATLGATRTYATPTSPAVGDIVRVKAGSVAQMAGFNMVISGSNADQIDGLTTVELESAYAAVDLICVSAGTNKEWRIF